MSHFDYIINILIYTVDTPLLHPNNPLELCATHVACQSQKMVEYQKYLILGIVNFPAKDRAERHDF